MAGDLGPADQDEHIEGHDERRGPLRRAVGWLFAPAPSDGGHADHAADGDDEESFTSWLDGAQPAAEAPFTLSSPSGTATAEPAPPHAQQEPESAPQSAPAVAPVREPDPVAEPNAEPAPAAEPDPTLATAETTVLPVIEAEPEPAVADEPADDLADGPPEEAQQPGSDLARRLAAANAAALARARTAPSVEDETVADDEEDEQAADEEGDAGRRTRRRHRPALGRSGGSDTPPRRRRRGRVVARLVLALAFAVLAVILLRTYVIAPYYIPSASMSPTLHGCTGCDDDRVLVDKLSYHTHAIHRGDVVVFHRPPKWNVSEKVLIKRVIGLPGEVLTTREGVVYVDGLAVDEPYVNAACRGGTKDLPKTIVPDGTIFVMGDNRCDSADSRSFGAVPKSALIGRAFLIIWPFGRIHWL
jgi:signal peptidase I